MTSPQVAAVGIRRTFAIISHPNERRQESNRNQRKGIT